jgi:hypothetical protein
MYFNFEMRYGLCEKSLLLPLFQQASDSPREIVDINLLLDISRFFSNYVSCQGCSGSDMYEECYAEKRTFQHFHKGSSGSTFIYYENSSDELKDQVYLI